MELLPLLSGQEVINSVRLLAIYLKPPKPGRQTWNRVVMDRKTLLVALSVSFLFVPGASYGQNAAVTSFDKLPDWSGVWSMVGGTIFDRATQTGEGGSVTPGVREHPPYNA